MTLPSKLLAYVSLGEDLCARAEGLAQAATMLLRSSGRRQTFRDRVLTGLALKIDGSFRALLDDCRAGRLEAMHHLKTMMEAFIYFHVVVTDDTEKTAEQVLAEATAHRKVLYLTGIAAPEDEIREWQELRDDLRGANKPLPKLEVLAKEHSAELRGWYSRVYRLACEPAHLGDLAEFMPRQNEEIRVASVSTASLRAQIALYYGIAIELAMFKDINETNDVGLSVLVDDLDERFHALSQAG